MRVRDIDQPRLWTRYYNVHQRTFWHWWHRARTMKCPTWAISLKSGFCISPRSSPHSPYQGWCQRKAAQPLFSSPQWQGRPFWTVRFEGTWLGWRGSRFKALMSTPWERLSLFSLPRMHPEQWADCLSYPSVWLWAAVGLGGSGSKLALPCPLSHLTKWEGLECKW